jgi:photosystem II stability/assembly factor-like uncharacterized protein
MAKSFFKNLILYVIIIFIFTGCSFLGLRIGKEGRKIPLPSNKKNLGAVFKSTNKGETFKLKAKVTDKKSIDKINVKSLQFDPRDSLTLYLLSKKQGLWVSYNGAESWEQLLNQLIETVALDNEERGVIYAAKNTTIFKSEDGGSSWGTIFIETSGQEIKFITVDPSNSKRILAATKDGSIFESKDQGQSWHRLNKLKIKTLKTIVINPKNPEEMYVTTSSEGVFKTIDAGAQWGKIAFLERFPGSGEVGQLKLNPYQPSHLYLASKYGILKSEDSGKTWEKISLLTPRNKTKILTLGFNLFNEKELYYGTKDSVFRSSDGGKNWTFSTLPTSRGPIEILVDDFDTNIVYVGVSN